MSQIGIFAGGMDFENAWHPVMHAEQKRQIVNLDYCKLCDEPFYPDSSGSPFCGRSTCREVRQIWAKEDMDFEDICQWLSVNH